MKLTNQILFFSYYQVKTSIEITRTNEIHSLVTSILIGEFLTWHEQSQKENFW
jgi:hypothetical protein